jgi:hypothetical protein
MHPNRLFIIILIVAGVATSAWANGKFYGTVSYKDCSCREASGGDAVHVWQNGGVSDFWNIVCDHFNPTGTYSTDNTYPAGYYYLAVDLATGSDCDQAIIKYIYHGSSDQRVDLEVRGPAGEPDGGGGN